jgi:hypothetical protein
MSDDLRQGYSVACQALDLYASLLAVCEAAANGSTAGLTLHARALSQRLDLVNALHCSELNDDAFVSGAAMRDVTSAALQLETQVFFGSRSYATTHQFAVALAYDAGTMLAVARVVDIPFCFETPPADQIIAAAPRLASLHQALADEIAAVGGMYHIRTRLQQEFVTAAKMRRDWLHAGQSPADKGADGQKAGTRSDHAIEASGRMSAREIAEKHGLDLEKLRRRLERWRCSAPTGWFEDEDPIRHQPRYFYDETAVLGVIQEMKAAGA